MSDSVLEFRVLSGPQAGCRLPVRSGLYQAGSGESCDILLAGDSTPETTFSLHIGHQEIAIEAGAHPLTMGGERFKSRHGPVPLPAGQIFTSGGTLYTVDHADAPWPDTPPAMETADAETLRADDGAVVPVNAEPVVESVNNAETAEPSPPSPVATLEPPRVRSRTRPPFWMVWLGGTAIFIGVGLFVLLLSLRPSTNAPLPKGPDNVALALEQTIATTKGAARLELDRLADSRWRVRGYVDSRTRYAELTRALREISPDIVLQFTADEDLLGLAREILKRYKQPNLEAASLRFGELTLRGRIASTAMLDKIGSALIEETHGLHTIRLDVVADDAKSSQGPSTTARAAPATGVVVAVLGPVPYVMLANGGKEGRQGGTPSTQGPQWTARP